jgi:hypothetical protein
MLPVVVGLHFAAAIWGVWAAAKKRIGTTVVMYLWGTLVATGIRYVFRDGGTADVLFPNAAPIIDQSLFCAWAPGAYLCALHEYGKATRKMVLFAAASSVAAAVVSLHVHKDAAASTLILQQLAWASALGLLLWDFGLGGSARDATAHIFGVLTVELYLAAWLGLRDRDEYLAPQTLTCLFFVALPLLDRANSRPNNLRSSA